MKKKKFSFFEEINLFEEALFQDTKKEDKKK